MGMRDLCGVIVKKQQSEPDQNSQDMEQLTGPKLEKEYIKAVYCHPAYLTYMWSISCEMPGWKKHKLESRLTGEISITSDMQMIPGPRCSGAGNLGVLESDQCVEELLRLHQGCRYRFALQDGRGTSLETL